MNSPKTQHIHIKSNKWEKDQLTKQAEAVGQTLSQYLRSLAYLSHEELTGQKQNITKAQK